MEIWKKSIFDYEVSNLGNIRKCRNEKNVKRYGGTLYNNIYIETNTNGYYRVKIKKKNYYIHHLVANAFLGETPNNQIIDHINRNRIDNKVENLRFVSYAGNRQNSDRVRTDIELPFGKEKTRAIKTKDQKIKRNTISLFNELPFK